MDVILRLGLPAFTNHKKNQKITFISDYCQFNIIITIKCFFVIQAGYESSNTAKNTNPR